MRLGVVLAVICPLVGCSNVTHDVAIRQVPRDTEERPVETVFDFEETGAAKLNASPYERIQPEAGKPDPNFTLSVLELDDDGALFDPRQIDDVRNHVIAEGANSGAIIITFVHGWKHNGTPCDDNLSCLRQILSNVESKERNKQSRALRANKIYTPRKVIGIYIGWRGLAQCSEPGKELSFWGRKQVAHSVGASQAREILQNIRDAHEHLLESEASAGSRLITVGHSFGAAVVYSAVESDILQEFLRATRSAKQGETLEPVAGYGDLVVLINPAFEAQQFRAINKRLGELHELGVKFSPNQPPILAVVSSEKDVPTHLFFPIGQALNLLAQPLRLVRGPMYWLRHTITIGNYWKFWTHYATQAEAWDTNDVQSAKETPNCYQGSLPSPRYSDCSCSQPTIAQAIADVTTGVDISKMSERQVVDLEIEVVGRGCRRVAGELRQCGNVTLEKRGKLMIPYNPYLFISAAREVSSGHTDVFNPTLVSLLEALVIENQKTPSTGHLR